MTRFFNFAVFLGCFVFVRNGEGTVLLPCKLICPARLGAPCQCWPPRPPHIPVTTTPPTTTVAVGKWSQWSEFSKCPECGTSYKQRSRQCETGNCIGDPLDFNLCDIKPCQYGNWGSWLYSGCSATCGVGTKLGSRVCIGEKCEGDSSIKKPCFSGSCFGVWASWESWSTCPQTCGEGIHSRKRICEGNNGQGCQGSAKEFKKCYEGKCPGLWGSWNAWSSCAVDVINLATNPDSLTGCLYRKKHRTRPCIENKCEGPSRDESKCAVADCLKQTGNTFKDGFGNVIEIVKKGAKPTIKFITNTGKKAGKFFKNLYEKFIDLF